MGCVHYRQWIAFRRTVLKGYQAVQLPTLQAVLELKSAPCGWNHFQVHLLDTVHPVAPPLIAASSLVAELPEDASPELKQAPFCGFLVTTRQEQLTKADHMFGCRQVLRAFIEECPEPPLYFGWGPMTAGVCPQAITRMAVGAALRCKRQAVVLLGGLELNVGHLSEPGDKELKAYAEDGKILFVRSAPHEWLFPRCSLVVHHGGIGTMACCMRSGVPELITPCDSEQIAQARLVSRLGIGEGLQSLAGLSVEALSSKIDACLANKDMQDRCKELSDKLQKEDGVKAAIEHVDKFLVDQVDTGKWKEAQEQRKREKQVLMKSSDGCFSWWLRNLGLKPRVCFAPPKK